MATAGSSVYLQWTFVVDFDFLIKVNGKILKQICSVFAAEIDMRRFIDDFFLQHVDNIS